jgi:hypothetical protein
MKRLLVVFLAVTMFFVAVMSSAAHAQISSISTFSRTREPTVNPAALREMLIKGLKVTRDDEKEYVNSVVARVVAKTLPVSIVYASFKYARTRRPYYPFPYFVFSVETLAKRNKK